MSCTRSLPELRTYSRGWRDGYVTGVTSDFAAVVLEGRAARLLEACGVPVKHAREIAELAFYDVASEYPERTDEQLRAAAAERIMRIVLERIAMEAASL